MCPFIDSADARCANHLTVRNVARAFAHCADHYRVCPVYQQLIAGRCGHDKDRVPLRLLVAS